MSKIRLAYTNSLGLPVELPTQFGHFTMNQSYLQSTTDFAVLYYGQELADQITYLYQNDLRCTVWINDIPIVYGFVSNKTLSSDKGAGITTKLQFRSLLGMLEKFSISPTTTFTGLETLDFIAKTVIYNDFIVHNEVLVNMDISADVSKLSYVHAPYTPNDPNIITFYGKVKTQDVQPKAGTTIYAFLQKLFHRNGLHMRDGVDKAGNPMILVSSPQPSRIDIYNGDKIVNMSADSSSIIFGDSDINGRSLVTKFEEKIDNAQLHSHFIFWGQSFSSLTLAGSFTCTPNKVIAINPIFKKNEKLPGVINKAVANYNLLVPPDEVVKMFIPDTWDEFIVQFADRIDSSQIKPMYKQETETTSYQELVNKVVMESRMNLYNAYTLTYELCNLGKHDDRFVFYAPDYYVSVYDSYANLTGSIMWVDTVETNWSKQGGLTQKLVLKIPGTIVFEESTGINTYSAPSFTDPSVSTPRTETPKLPSGISRFVGATASGEVSSYALPVPNTSYSNVGSGDSSN